MNKIYVPTNSPEDWKPLLAKPDKHWRTGYSAKALAYCWQEANGFPKSVIECFNNSKLKLFSNIELLLAIPEYKVELPGGIRPSQNDIFVLARGNNQLISIMVEGKVDEPFDITVGEWERDASRGKEERLAFLLNQLGLDDVIVSHVRYQLLHRTASAIIEARQFRARNALTLVHSFSQTGEHYGDYKQFVELFNKSCKINSIVHTGNIDDINLYLGWATGEEEYLKK